MKTSEEHADEVATQIEMMQRKGARCKEIARELDIPLPIECENQSSFQFMLDGAIYYLLGSVCGDTGRLRLSTEHYDSCCSILSGELFSSIEEIHSGCKIVKFGWMSNNHNLPEWNPIPEPPECKIYRFQSLQHGIWLDSDVKITGDHYFYIRHDDFSITKQAFWSLYTAKHIKDFRWVDRCDELGEWPGNNKD